MRKYFIILEVVEIFIVDKILEDFYESYNMCHTIRIIINKNWVTRDDNKELFEIMFSSSIIDVHRGIIKLNFTLRPLFEVHERLKITKWVDTMNTSYEY